WRPLSQAGDSWLFFRAAVLLSRGKAQMTANPLTSVVIPARDAEKTIVRTFESLLVQTDARWEALVVDDGSVDATPTITASYAAGDGRFIALRSNGHATST